MIKLSDGRVVFSHFEEKNAQVVVDITGDKNSVILIKKSDGTILATIMTSPVGIDINVTGVWGEIS